MHKLRSPAHRDIGLRVARITTFCAAVAAITGIVVADVTAAEAEQPIALALVAEDPVDAVAERSADAEVPVLLAAAVAVPDALPVLTPPEPIPPKKKRRASKLKFGRFEGY